MSTRAAARTPTLGDDAASAAAAPDPAMERTTIDFDPTLSTMAPAGKADSP